MFACRNSVRRNLSASPAPSRQRYDFYGRTPDELRHEFRASLDFFLETCTKHGMSPKKQASGKFLVRISPVLHAQAATAARAAGISLNALVEKAVRHELRAG
jgi:predicted HicB family RNase H-like nuclease